VRTVVNAWFVCSTPDAGLNVQVTPAGRLGQLNVNWSARLLSDMRLTLKSEELPTPILAEAGVTEIDASSSCNCANAHWVFPDRVPLMLTL
jgi:hypothetical protein